MSAEWFEEFGTEGLMALSGAQGGEIGQLLAAGQLPAAKALTRHYASLFSGRFYIEVQRYGQPHAEAYIAQASELAVSLGPAGGGNPSGTVSNAL